MSPASMPWKTQVMGPSFADKPKAVTPPGPSGSLTAAPSPSPYDWTMTADWYGGPLTGSAVFGTADQSAAPVTSMDITGNASGVMAGNGDGYVVVVSDGPANMTAADTVAAQSWNLSGPNSGGANGIYIYILKSWTHPHAATDVITVTSDTPVRMIGAVYQIDESGNPSVTVGLNTGYSDAAWVDGATQSGDAITFIASDDGTPNDPAGYTSVGTMRGAGHPLYFTVAHGTPV